MAERIEGGFKNRVFSFLSIFIIHLKRRERVPFFYGNSLRVPNAGPAARSKGGNNDPRSHRQLVLIKSEEKNGSILLLYRKGDEKNNVYRKRGKKCTQHVSIKNPYHNWLCRDFFWKVNSKNVEFIRYSFRDNLVLPIIQRNDRLASFFSSFFFFWLPAAYLRDVGTLSE